MINRIGMNDCFGMSIGPSPATGVPFVTGDMPLFHLSLTSNERHDLLKLTANESGLFRKVYEASTVYSPRAINDFTGTFTLIGTGVNDKWLASLGYRCNPVHPNPEKMPEVSHVGRRVRWFSSGSTTKSPKYETGTVHSHYVSGDDCSGYWGRQCYTVKQDKNGELLSPLGPDCCEFIDGPTPVYFPYRWTMGAENPRPDWIYKKVRVVGKYVRAGPSGNPLVEGQTGIISRISPVTCAWAFWVTPPGGGQDFSVNPSDCEFIDFL